MKMSKEPPLLSGTNFDNYSNQLKGNCEHKRAHSTTIAVHCTVVQIEIVCDQCGQILKEQFEV